MTPERLHKMIDQNAAQSEIKLTLEYFRLFLWHISDDLGVARYAHDVAVYFPYWLP